MENKQSSLKLLFVAQAAFWLRFGLIAPVLALFIRRAGIAVTDIGLLMMIQSIGWAIFEPTFGMIADRFGKKILAIYSIVATSPIYIAYTFANSIWHFYLLGFALSSNMAAGSVSNRAMTIDLLPAAERGKVYGRFMATLAMGMSIGPFLGGFLADAISITTPFYLCSGLGIISLAALLPMKYSGRPQSDKELSAPILVRSQLLTKTIISLLFVRLLFSSNFHFQRSILPIFLNESQSLQASESQIGFYMGSISFTSAISQFFLGALADRVGSKKLIALGLFASGLSYLDLIYINGVTPLYLLGVFQGIFFAAVDISMMIYLMAIIPKDSSGRAMGFYGLSEDLGGMVAAPSLGMIYDRFGPIFSILYVSTVLICNAVLSIFFLKTNEQHHSQKAG